MTRKNRRKRIRNVLTLAVSCAIMVYYVIGVGLNQFLPSSISITQDNMLQSSSPDNSSTGLIVKRFDKAGDMHYTMTASRADFFTEAVANAQNPVDESPEQAYDTLLMEDFSMGEDANGDQGDLAYYPQQYQDSQQRRYNGQEHLRVINPRFAIHKEGIPATVLDAKMAYIIDNGDSAELIGDVQVNDLLAATQLNTEALTLNTALQQILTQNPVTIQTPSSTTHATGLQGNLTDQRWHLLTEVRSVIQP